MNRIINSDKDERFMSILTNLAGSQKTEQLISKLKVVAWMGKLQIEEIRYEEQTVCAAERMRQGNQ